MGRGRHVRSVPDGLRCSGVRPVDLDGISLIGRWYGLVLNADGAVPRDHVPCSPRSRTAIIDGASGSNANALFVPVALPEIAAAVSWARFLYPLVFDQRHADRATSTGQIMTGCSAARLHHLRRA